MKNKKIIIALVANIGAGKSFVADYIFEKSHSEIIKYSHTLSEILTLLAINKERKNFANLSKALRQEFGEDVLENSIINKIKNSTKEVIILDGIRREEDMDIIQKMDDFNLVFIDTTLETRSARMKTRAEKDDDKHINTAVLNKDEQHDSENRVDDLKSRADFIIDNNGTLEDLKNNIDDVIGKILNR